MQSNPAALTRIIPDHATSFVITWSIALIRVSALLEGGTERLCTVIAAAADWLWLEGFVLLEFQITTTVVLLLSTG
jgi:hypothetical protein